MRLLFALVFLAACSPAPQVVEESPPAATSGAVTTETRVVSITEPIDLPEGYAEVLSAAFAQDPAIQAVHLYVMSMGPGEEAVTTLAVRTDDADATAPSLTARYGEIGSRVLEREVSVVPTRGVIPPGALEVYVRE